MIFEQFYLACLAQASYLIGSDGVAAVIDPQRDVDIYLAAAREHGLRIAHVIETHLHADFVSGHRELAERTGAQIYLGAGSGATFPHVTVHEGDEIALGDGRLRFVQTPGHTMESVCVLASEGNPGAEPWAIFTGDTLFIGDVGRPDLAETCTPQQLAGHLYESLHEKILTLPDSVAVYPAHGAGSMCGRNISQDRSSTIGRERQFNYALQPMSQDEFVRLVTTDLPPRPEYFQRDIDLNRRGAVTLADLPPLRAIGIQEAAGLRRCGAAILDVRTSSDFCAGHIPGSINIGLNGQFAAWAGAVLGLDRELVLIAEERKAIDEARERLARVGIERVAGFIDGGVAGWVRGGLPLEQTAQISVHQLEAEISGAGVSDNALSILDVRRSSEWKAGHVTGAKHAPLDDLQKRIPELDCTRMTAVYCKSGYRSTIACSLLQASGFKKVLNVLGGFDAWAAARLPVVDT